MVKWEAYQGSSGAEQWDRWLLESEDRNVFQSFAWGEYKRLSDWIPVRSVARDHKGSIVGMVQILTRKYFPSLMIGWAPGGPISRFSGHTEQKHEDLVPALLETIKSNYKTFWVRFDNYAPLDSPIVTAFTKVLVRPPFKLNTGYSIHLNLENSLDELRAKMIGNHRRNIRKALHEKLEWKVGNDAQSIRAFLQLHDEMTKTKRLDALSVSNNEVTSLCRTLGKGAVIFTGYEENIPVTSCLVLIFGCKAFYRLAATGSKGRKIDASYAMVYRLLEYLQARGIKQFDFGGIAPGSAAVDGVNYFKGGFGGEIVERLGEWEWASSRWVRWSMNLVMRYRNRFV